MIQVTRAEADVLREKAPNAHIAIVNRGHRNKKYYAEESREAKRVIGELRGTWKPRENKWKRRPNKKGNNSRPAYAGNGGARSTK